MIISLLGYMGSGKSHVAKKLNDKIDFRLIDLDSEISHHMGMNIPNIFKKKGELAFRKTEKKILDELVCLKDDLILSLGGGTPVYYDNMEVILANTESFFLRTKIPTLYRRLLKQKQNRPMIARLKDDDIPEFIGKHLFERNAFYNRAAYIVDTDNKTPDEVAEEIVNTLGLHR